MQGREMGCMGGEDPSATRNQSSRMAQISRARPRPGWQHPAAQAAIGCTLALGGFLAGRRGFEFAVSLSQGHGFGAGLARAAAAAGYLAFVGSLIAAVLRLMPGRDQLSRHLPAYAVGHVVPGFGLGGAIVATTLMVDLATGRASLTGEATHVNLIRSLSGGLVQLGAIAFAEELVFRLALFRLASMVAPRWAGIVISSLAYAAVHIGEGGPQPIYAASLFCFGVVACELYVMSKLLWLSAGAHWGWDYVSFLAFQTLSLNPLGPAWLTGQPYRLSTGLVMLVVLAMTAAALIWRARRSPSW